MPAVASQRRREAPASPSPGRGARRESDGCDGGERNGKVSYSSWITPAGHWRFTHILRAVTNYEPWAQTLCKLFRDSGFQSRTMAFVIIGASVLSKRSTILA